MKTKVKTFEDLTTWQEARKLVRMVYSFSSSLKDFGYRDQIQRASISVMANIAEGMGHLSDKELKRFLIFSLRSCFEVQSHLYAGLDIGYLNKDKFDELFNQTKSCSNLLKGFLKYLEN